MHPMSTASRIVICFSPRFCVATRSANHITALQAIRAMPTHPQRAQPTGDHVLEQQADDADGDACRR